MRANPAYQLKSMSKHSHYIDYIDDDEDDDVEIDYMGQSFKQFRGNDNDDDHAGPSMPAVPIQ